MSDEPRAVTENERQLLALLEDAQIERDNMRISRDNSRLTVRELNDALEAAVNERDEASSRAAHASNRQASAHAMIGEWEGMRDDAQAEARRLRDENAIAKANYETSSTERDEMRRERDHATAEVYRLGKLVTKHHEVGAVNALRWGGQCPVCVVDVAAVKEQAATTAQLTPGEKKCRADFERERALYTRYSVGRGALCPEFYPAEELTSACDAVDPHVRLDRLEDALRDLADCVATRDNDADRVVARVLDKEEA